MSDAPISVEGIGKQYRLGSMRTGYATLRDSLGADARRQRADAREDRFMWALRDVSFAVEKGEAVGVIGANGAGKSTLLKILSRITTPTEGRAAIRGRVASLLEVGTGFHPELTGRENVYLSGAILGMRRKEITRQLDTIAGFAQVERYLDTPLKRYSTGMGARLAFSVAAHLPAEILLVDEVLSVGDFAFQRKSLGKMREQTESAGRTVLFVSHNMGAIKTLTKRCLWLDRGQVRAFGPTNEVFTAYVESHSESASSGVADLSDLDRGITGLAQDVVFESLELRGADGRVTNVFLEDEPIDVRLRLRDITPMQETRLEILFRIYTMDGVLVAAPWSWYDGLELEHGIYETSFRIDPNPFSAGTYSVELYVVSSSEDKSDQGQDAVRTALTFQVAANPQLDENAPLTRTRDVGLVRVDGRWQPLERSNAAEYSVETRD
jgi:lipopolysaccharide transport system ATP-binding protein